MEKTFAEKARILADWIVYLRNAWKVHPSYDGNDANPYVRAVCEVEETLSYTITQLNDAFGQLHRLEKAAGKLAPLADFSIQPIRPDDPLHEFMALDYWSIPTPQRKNYLKREAFRRNYPALAPLLTHARRVNAKPAGKHPDTGKKSSKKEIFMRWSRDHKPDLCKKAANLLVCLEDIWDVALGKLSLEEVESLGIMGMQLDLFTDSKPKKGTNRL